MAALIGAGALMRIEGMLRSSIWYDEAFTLWLARLPLLDLIRTVAHDYSPPLWDMLVWFAVRLVGLMGGRMLALICSLVSMWLAWLIMDHFKFDTGQRLFVCAGLLLPQFVWMAQDARMYALFSMLYLAAVLFALREQMLGLAAVCGLMLFCHNAAIFYVAPILLIAVLSSSPGWRSSALYAGGLAGVLYLPWAGTIYRQAKNLSAHWILDLSPAFIGEQIRLLFFAGSLQTDLWILAGQWLISWALIVALFSQLSKIKIDTSWLDRFVLPQLTIEETARWVALRGARTAKNGDIGQPGYWRLFILAAGPTALMLCAALWKNILYYRPLLPSMIPVVIWMAAILTPTGDKPAKYRYVLLGGLSVVLVVSLLGMSPETKGGHVAHIVEGINTGWQDGDIVYHATATSLLPTSYYLPNKPNYLLPMSRDASAGLLSWNMRRAFNLPEIRMEDIPYRRAWIFYADDPAIPDFERRMMANYLYGAQLVGTIRYWQMAPIYIYLKEKPEG